MLELSEQRMREYRWAEISMVFQGAMNAWNPVYRVGKQIREAMYQHFDPPLGSAETDRRVERLFELVGLDPAVQTAIPTSCRAGCASGR